MAAGLHSTPARADSRACDRYAAPRGSDKHGRGTARHPFHSVGRLDRALRPGQTGCLLPGTYGALKIDGVLLLNPGRYVVSSVTMGDLPSG